ncbi:hypothetical protein EDD17DRAFT_1514976 [Pisolithus thermaeus]|nr:hypothetical protein EV401DRAFT_1883547 [Pisolithus croceorrhizus]KAI6144880.1 hypothetical protein EDD17DRAFT_1514976 [Pisolithus thermaeus]
MASCFPLSSFAVGLLSWFFVQVTATALIRKEDIPPTDHHPVSRPKCSTLFHTAAWVFPVIRRAYGCDRRFTQTLRCLGARNAFGREYLRSSSDRRGIDLAVVGVEDASTQFHGIHDQIEYHSYDGGKFCIFISDKQCYMSMRMGPKQSIAHVRMFKPNDVGSLGGLLREVVGRVRPKMHRSRKKDTCDRRELVL